VTNEELYDKIPSAMHQLRERRLTFAGHCHRCEDQPVKHLVLLEGRAGRMLRGQAGHCYRCEDQPVKHLVLWEGRAGRMLRGQAGHCYRCEDQPVKHLVLWEGGAGRMLRGQANRLTYVKQLLRDACCETVDELQRMMKNRAEWARVSHTITSCFE